ncbi:MAG: DUF3341 domain-containing protein [Candidatus Kapabacteria bacterium]|nr:DUF3341 domain-containing protein [Candidatus Kapabacteria bacterium]
MKVTGVLGDFKDVNHTITAAQQVNEAGYREFDFFTPYPVHGLDKAMGVKRTILPYISFVGACAGLATALGLQWWTGAVDYKLNIGGKQLFAIQFSVPIDFELTVLLCALSTVAGLFHLCRIPTWWHPFQNDEGFKKATDDTFVLGIYATDDRFHVETVKTFMHQLGAANVRVCYDEPADATEVTATPSVVTA